MKTWRGAGSVGAGDVGVRADRLRRRPWTDPRLLLGVLLVLGAMVVGARVVAALDDTVEFWAVAGDVRAGDTVNEDDLVAVDVRLADRTADTYLRVDAELPSALDDAVWSRDVAAGTLVDPAAWTQRSTADSRQLPVTVAEGALPADLDRGDQVEVWVGAEAGTTEAAPAERVLANVTVLRSGAGSGALDGGASRTVLLEVPTTALSGKVVAAVASGHVTLVRLP